MSNNKTPSNKVSEFYGALTRKDFSSTDFNHIKLLLDSNFRVSFNFNEGRTSNNPTYENFNIVDVSLSGDHIDLKLQDIYNKFCNTTNKDITYLVQIINIPNLKNDMTLSKVENMFGGINYSSMGSVVPNKFEFTVDFVSSESLFIENLIIPWMTQLKSARWVYPDVPYATATITVDVFDQTGENIITRYHLHDVVPSTADTLDLSHEPTKSFTRSVNFTFDYMTIENNTSAGKKAVTEESDDGGDAYAAYRNSTLGFRGIEPSSF